MKQSLRLIGLLLALAAAPALAKSAPAAATPAKVLAERLKQAKTADPATQFQLGLDYRTGTGVPRDPAQAYKWIHLAALGNLAEAQFTVGLMDAAGEGTPRKLSDAADWFRKASKQGHLRATILLADMSRDGTGIAVDRIGAARLYRIAAERNDMHSILALANAYLTGQGVPKSAGDAANWLRRGAWLGNEDARYRLALVLLDGDPAVKLGHKPSRNGLEAAFWLQEAADQGYAPAQYSLGMAYYGGISMPLDRYRALDLINRAADQSYAPALRELAFFYRTGRLTSKDPLRALMYLELAEQFGDQHAHLDRDEMVRDIPVAQQLLAKKRAQEWLSGRGL
jgi:TPR repeat protein